MKKDFCPLVDLTFYKIEQNELLDLIEGYLKYQAILNDPIPEDIERFLTYLNDTDQISYKTASQELLEDIAVRV